MTRKILPLAKFLCPIRQSLIRARKKSILGSLIILYLFSISAYAENNVLYIKSDSSWRATANPQSGLEWTKTEFDDSSWASSSANWVNNPCYTSTSYMEFCTISYKDWMWQGDTCDNCTRYFRKEIIISTDVEYAKLQISADDVYWLYVNGNFIGDIKEREYAAVKTYDILNYLHKGKNIIAIKAYEKQGYEGVVVSGEVRFVDQTINQLITQLQSQVSTLTEDKKRLNSQIDTLQSDINSLNSNKDNLIAQISDLQSRLISSSNNRDELEKKLSQQRMINLILIVILVLFIVICYYLYLQNKKLYRKPTLSSVPIKKEKGKR